MFAVTILGNNSALPAWGRFPTAQILQTNDESFLIDCGEGTQMQINRYKIRAGRIKTIFISHMHGDHYFGLPGLITSFALGQRTEPLHIHCPKELPSIMDAILNASNTKLPYEVIYHPITEEKEIYNDAKISVTAFRVNHRIDCFGFLFTEKKNPRKIDPDRARSFDIPPEYFSELQQGKDYVSKKGTIIPNAEVTVAAAPARSYAYCADTLFDERIANKIKDADLVYHEATFLNDSEDRAKERFHSTAGQAAKLATLANAKRLIIGHFSSRYETLDEFLVQAQEQFENCELALEGACFTI